MKIFNEHNPVKIIKFNLTNPAYGNTRIMAAEQPFHRLKIPYFLINFRVNLKKFFELNFAPGVA